MEILFRNAVFGYRRRDVPVLDNLNLSISAGRTILLGPNGAGKSTLLAVAASALKLRSGGISVNGLTAETRRNRSEYRRRVGWMPQSTQAASGLTVREHVALHGWLAGLARAEAWDRSMSVLCQVSLQDLADRRATTLSGGQRARMGLAQTLVHGADVLLLDEPTAALDPDQRESFVNLMADIADNRTILVSTHDVSDLTDSYEHVVVLDRGEVRFQGSTGAFVAGNQGPLSAVAAYRRAIGQD